MAFLFKPKTKPIVGVDISSTAIKLVELSRSGNRYRVESYGVQPLPASAVVERLIRDPQAVGDAMRRVVSKVKPKSRDVVLAVPGSAVITKIIEMDKDLFDYEIENQLRVEAEQYIPYAIDEVNLDFTVLGPSEDNPEKDEVLLAASQTEVVNQLTEVAEIGGLKPAIIDVEAYALERAYQEFLASEVEAEGGENQVIALVDVGATTTTLYIFQNQQVIYMRDQLFGGKQLTDEIQRRYGISAEEAGLAKKQGGLPPDYEPEVLRPFKDALIQQIERSLQFFYSASSVNQVDRILLSGGTSLMDGLKEEVQGALGVITLLANPLTHIDMAGRVNRSRLLADGTALMIALGLALRSFDHG